jgi:hypothetical protein
MSTMILPMYYSYRYHDYMLMREEGVDTPNLRWDDNPFETLRRKKGLGKERGEGGWTRESPWYVGLHHTTHWGTTNGGGKAVIRPKRWRKAAYTKEPCSAQYRQQKCKKETRN